MSLEELVPGGRIEDGRPVAQRSKSADRSGPGIDIESPNWIAVLQQILQHPIAVAGDDAGFSGMMMLQGRQNDDRHMVDTVSPCPQILLG